MMAPFCANASMPDSCTGVFFTLPETNTFVTIPGDSLCWGQSPQSPKIITAPKVFTVLDAFTERYYLSLDVSYDPDKVYRQLDGWAYTYNYLTTSAENWKTLDLSDPHPSFSIPWASPTKRDFSGRIRIFPDGSNILNTVRKSLISMAKGKDAFPEFDLSPYLGSTLFGSDQVINIGWCSNETYQVQLLNARKTRNFGKCYAWFKEAISSTIYPYPIMSLGSVANGSGASSELEKDFWSYIVNKSESLQTTLESVLQSSDGKLSAGWLQQPIEKIRISSDDFAWMNALLMSMDTVSSFAGPFPQFMMRDEVVSAHIEATATIDFSNLHLHTPSEGSNFLAFDASITTLNHSDVPIQKSTWHNTFAEWTFHDPHVSAQAEYFFTNAVYVARSELEYALRQVDYGDGEDWENVMTEYVPSTEGIFIYAVKGGDAAVKRELIHQIQLSDLSAYGGTKTVDNASYSVYVSTTYPISDIVCSPFASSGAKWYASGYSGPSLIPSPNVSNLINKILLQGYATWTIDGFNTNIVQVMASGLQADGNSITAVNRAADNIIMEMLSGRKAMVNELADADVTDPKGIESRLSARLLSSSPKVAAIGFAASQFSVRSDGSGGLEFSGSEIDAEGNIKIGSIRGGAAWSDSKSLQAGTGRLDPKFSLLTVYNFYNLPSPKSANP